MSALPIQTPEEMVQGSIKGAAFREFVRWCTAEFGYDKMVTTVARMPEEMRPRLDLEDACLGIISSRWYEARLVHALLDALTHGLSADQRLAMAQKASHAVMAQTLRGLYRVLFDWMATPRRYAKYASKLWNSYYDSGLFVVTMPDENSAVCVIRDWYSHHPMICDLNHGAAAAIYINMGCKDVHVNRQACVARGDPECRFLTTWSDIER